MKKRKEEILRSKEQSTEQSKEHSTEQSTEKSTAQPNNTCVYGVGMFAILAIGVCIFFAYNSFSKNKKQANEKKDQPPKRRHML